MFDFLICDKKGEEVLRYINSEIKATEKALQMNFKEFKEISGNTLEDIMRKNTINRNNLQLLAALDELRKLRKVIGAIYDH